MFKQSLARLVPRTILQSLQNYRILSVQFGQYRSIRLKQCVDHDGQPVPWYTYPAIEYLRQLDLSEKTVFEYGSGHSTLFWAQRCRKLVSVEDRREWYERIQTRLRGNVEYLLLENRLEYIRAIERYPDPFDVIIIDGRDRYECAMVSRPRLRGDGFMILDNSDWKEKTSKLLRDSGLIEVDMAGFGPINAYTWTTSFYFARNVSLRPSHENQPVHGIGSMHVTEA